MVYKNIYIFQFCNGENLQKKSKILGNYLHYKNTSLQKVPKNFGEKNCKICPKISLVRLKSRAKTGKYHLVIKKNHDRFMGISI